MRVYTVHQIPGSSQPDREAVLVKEGFCWPAFFFSVVWALWNGMWLAALAFFIVVAVAETIAQLLGLDPITDAALSLAAALLIGGSANDLRRRSLDRRGYDLAGLVAATHEDAALRRWFDIHPPAASAWR
jgi:hypothetical protein